VLDINLLREEKGGNPELVRTSQKKRFGDVTLVDQVLLLLFVITLEPRVE